MSLQLFELVPTTPSREAAEALIAQVSQAVEAAGASVLESQVTASHERIFTIVELGSDDVAALTVEGQRMVGAGVFAGLELRLGDGRLEGHIPQTGGLLLICFPTRQIVQESALGHAPRMFANRVVCLRPVNR